MEVGGAAHLELDCRMREKMVKMEGGTGEQNTDDSVGEVVAICPGRGYV